MECGWHAVMSGPCTLVCESQLDVGLGWWLAAQDINFERLEATDLGKQNPLVKVASLKASLTGEVRRE